MTPMPEVLELRVEADVVICRQAVRGLAQGLRFSLVDQTRMITAASELARNTLVYGGGGQMRWAVVQREARAGLRLDFEDHGQGIPDIALALTDGWTSGSGLGLGLSGARRLVDEFELDSKPGSGTSVTVVKWSR